MIDTKDYLYINLPYCTLDKYLLFTMEELECKNCVWWLERIGSTNKFTMRSDEISIDLFVVKEMKAGPSRKLVQVSVIYYRQFVYYN